MQPSAVEVMSAPATDTTRTVPTPSSGDAYNLASRAARALSISVGDKATPDGRSPLRAMATRSEVVRFGAPAGSGKLEMAHSPPWRSAAPARIWRSDWPGGKLSELLAKPPCVTSDSRLKPSAAQNATRPQTAVW